MTDRRLHVQATGSGPGLLLTHGYGDTSATWDAQVPTLARRFETRSWDLIGHGASACPDDPAAFTRETALDDLERVVAGAAEPLVLVGHSLGGYLSLCFAIQTSERVRALVLVATGPGYRDPESRAQWNRGARLAPQRFGLPQRTCGILEQRDSLVIDALDRVTMPALLLVGEKDTRFHAGMRYLEKRLGAPELVIVPGGKHQVHRTHASQVNAAIERFLDHCAA